MIRVLVSVLAVIWMACPIDAQDFWKTKNERNIQLKQNQERTIIPDKYSSFQLDLASLKTYLKMAPLETQYNVSLLPMSIPLPDGSIQRFNVMESSCMESEIQNRFPGIRSFTGTHVEDSSQKIRFDYGPKGFRAAIHSSKGTIYIDPYATNQSRVLHKLLYNRSPG